MKQRFILFRRAGVYYTEDTTTRQQISLRTKDEAEALTLLHSKNEAHRQPVLNLHIARTYLAATDPEIGQRTWQAPMDEMTRTKTGPTLIRYKRAMQDRAFDIILDHAPNLRAIENDSNTRFNFIYKGVTQSGNLSVVIAPGRNEFGQCFVNEAMPHCRTLPRAFLSASVPSTSRAVAERTAARRSRTSSKWARSTPRLISPDRLARSFSTSNARPLVGRFNASSSTISSERAMLKEYYSGCRLQGCSLLDLGESSMSEVFLRLGDSVLVTIQVGTTRRGVQGGIVLNLHGRLGEAFLPEQLLINSAGNQEGE